MSRPAHIRVPVGASSTHVRLPSDALAALSPSHHLTNYFNPGDGFLNVTVTKMHSKFGRYPADYKIGRLVPDRPAPKVNVTEALENPRDVLFTENRAIIGYTARTSCDQRQHRAIFFSPAGSPPSFNAEL